MTESERLQFYKSLYDQEFDHREQIRGGFALPVGVLTALIGLWYKLAELWWDVPSGWMETAFNYFGLLAPAFFLLSIIYLIRAYVGHSYSMFQRPAAILAFEAELATWNAEMDAYERAHGPTGRPRRTLEQRLIEELAAAADVNSATNRRRSALVYSGGLTMVLGGLALVGAYLIVMSAKLQ